MEISSESIDDREIIDANRFYYDELMKIDWSDPSSIVEGESYEAFVEHAVDKGFVRLHKKAKETSEKPTLMSMISEGYKIHMSIHDSSNENRNLHKAWAIVVNTSLRYNIDLVKIVRNEYRDLMRSGDKFGKEITWYSFKDDFTPDRIQSFLTELTIQFRDQGIIPGAKAIHDHGSINNSNYFTYRNDGPLSASNPFENIRIDVNDQPLRQSYKNTTLEADMPQRIVMDADAISEGPEYNEDLGDASGCSKCCRP